ncbi:hypothetical protein PENANT_c035G04440 [Penicillium antarcticum]|uniref:ER membrane protein complex subunit 10 n=1 Tax=Penicillium antarcticum TaxID=416450 RepID=A0A1V6PTU8_9EURO|nr:uncharacterized protein N7508_009985 [Penicillium antarcticum]KAJ5295164.1 hypothetical protein N7508_009985 [Penicillium antarcticum]OQD80444.1 hypothetical protein PENANT_c035G04440 [Penicillium antarcticum]
MRFLQMILSALSLLVSVNASSPVTDILYWPVGSAQPSILARVTYDSASMKSDVLSYTPPKNQDDGLVRVGLYTSAPTNNKQWVGSLVSASSLTGNGQPTIRLHLGPANEVYHVSLGAPSAIQGSSNSAQVDLVANELGAQPHLNRPVVVNPDGGNAEEPEEKSLLQRYWWLLPILFFLTMSGGGEGQS